MNKVIIFFMLILVTLSFASANDLVTLEELGFINKPVYVESDSANPQLTGAYVYLGDIDYTQQVNLSESGLINVGSGYFSVDFVGEDGQIDRFAPGANDFSGQIDISSIVVDTSETNRWMYGTINELGLNTGKILTSPGKPFSGKYTYLNLASNVLLLSTWSYTHPSGNIWTDLLFPTVGGSNSYYYDGDEIFSLDGVNNLVDDIVISNPSPSDAPALVVSFVDVNDASDLSFNNPLQAKIMATSQSTFSEVRLDVVNNDRTVYTQFAPDSDLSSSTVVLDAMWYTPLVVIGGSDADGDDGEIITYTLLENANGIIKFSIAGTLTGFTPLVYLYYSFDLVSESITLTGASTETTNIPLGDLDSGTFIPQYYAADGITVRSGNPVPVEEDFVGVVIEPSYTYDIYARGTLTDLTTIRKKYEGLVQVSDDVLDMDLQLGMACTFSQQCSTPDAVCSLSTRVCQLVGGDDEFLGDFQNPDTSSVVSDSNRAIYVEPQDGHGGYGVWVKDTLGNEMSLQDAVRNRTISALGGSVCGYNSCVNTVDGVFDITGDCSVTSNIVAIGSCTGRDCEAFSCGKGCTAYKTCWECAFTYGGSGFANGDGSESMASIRNQLTCPQWPYQTEMVPTDSGFICKESGPSTIDDQPDVTATGQCDKQVIVTSCGNNCLDEVVKYKCYFTSGDVKSTGWGADGTTAVEMMSLLTCPIWPYEAILEPRENDKFICKKNGTSPPSPRDAPRVEYSVDRPLFSETSFVPPGQLNRIPSIRVNAVGFDSNEDGVNDTWASNGGTTIDIWDLDFDGSPDAWDTTGNGQINIWDLDFNRRADAWDTTNDGRINSWDTTGNGRIDTWDNTGDGIGDSFDTTSDGRINSWDTTGDGNINMWDTTGNGNVDMWDTNGDSIADQFDTSNDGVANQFDATEPFNGIADTGYYYTIQGNKVTWWDTTGDGDGDVFDYDGDGQPDS